MVTMMIDRLKFVSLKLSLFWLSLSFPYIRSVLNSRFFLDPSPWRLNRQISVHSQCKDPRLLPRAACWSQMCTLAGGRWRYSLRLTRAGRWDRPGWYPRRRYTHNHHGWQLLTQVLPGNTANHWILDPFSQLHVRMWGPSSMQPNPVLLTQWGTLWEIHYIRYMSSTFLFKGFVACRRDPVGHNRLTKLYVYSGPCDLRPLYLTIPCIFKTRYQ